MPRVPGSPGQIKSNQIPFMPNPICELCSGSEAGSYVRLIDFVYHSTLGLKVMEKKRILPVVFQFIWAR